VTGVIATAAISAVGLLVVTAFTYLIVATFLPAASLLQD
jgi:hypothetical protein